MRNSRKPSTQARVVSYLVLNRLKKLINRLLNFKEPANIESLWKHTLWYRYVIKHTPNNRLGGPEVQPKSKRRKRQERRKKLNDQV